MKLVFKKNDRGTYCAESYAWTIRKYWKKWILYRNGKGAIGIYRTIKIAQEVAQFVLDKESQ